MTLIPLFGIVNIVTITFSVRAVLQILKVILRKRYFKNIGVKSKIFICYKMKAWMNAVLSFQNHSDFRIIA